MRIIYTFFIIVYGFAIRIASLFNTKAKLWVNGRKDQYPKIKKALSENHKPLIWVHAASLGEFEQGRPIIEALKAKHAKYGIILTFFSPSGFEIRKNYEFADFVFYLPLDTPKNARQFLEIVPIELAIFIKYEYWYNYLSAIQKKHIPIVFISAIFRKQQLFFKAYGTWFLQHLKAVDWFFVQTSESLNLLQKIGITNASISGDTRFDRVAAIAQSAKENALVEKFKGSSKLLLAGSSWPEDEAIIYPLLLRYPDLKIIFAPHQIDQKHINSIEKNALGKAFKYSDERANKLTEKQVLIIDNFGLLSSLYRYADFTFIGGGFGAGIHNTLEAATFGMPIFIGPKYEKFQEAKELIQLEVIEVVENEIQLEQKLSFLLKNPNSSEKKANAARQYVQKQTGATAHILSTLEIKKIIE
ncbi:MAG: 3-deoxy-D-manno-octulosonic acid transferase [Bacteroidales bacterium]|nr:3-deoxy-D-manno-octulosonic acid transferase [Bacteroidales bacterium]